MHSTHTWAIQQVVWVSLFAVPSRAKFLDLLAAHTRGGMPAALDAAHTFVNASELVIARIQALYDGPCVNDRGD